MLDASGCGHNPRRMVLSLLPRTAHRLAALVLVGMVLLALPACSKSKAKPAAASPTASASPSPRSESQAQFVLAGVRPVDAQDRESANPVANEVAAKVIGIVNSYYNVAFVQPSHWVSGTHPDLPGLFTPDAAASVGPNLQALALGAQAAPLARVDPTAQTSGDVAVLIEPNLAPSYATVSTHFEGTGVPGATSGTTVHITVDAQFLVDVAAGYKISGYDVSTTINGTPKAAAYKPPAGGALGGNPA
ncbi:MAG: hypothetical protein NVSMB32_17140 [Actinomycetota bacterium]